jgi:hypothetical protein
MDSIFGIVIAALGYHVYSSSQFFSSKDDAIARYVEIRDGLEEYDDPTVIELFELNTKTMEKKIIDSFKGPIDHIHWGRAPIE